MPRDWGGRGRGRGTRSSANAETQRAGVYLRAGPSHQQLGWECAFASVRPQITSLRGTVFPGRAAGKQPSGREIWPKGRRRARVSRCSRPLCTCSCPFTAHGPRGGGSPALRTQFREIRNSSMRPASPSRGASLQVFTRTAEASHSPRPHPLASTSTRLALLRHVSSFYPRCGADRDCSAGARGDPAGGFPAPRSGRT